MGDRKYGLVGCSIKDRSGRCSTEFDDVIVLGVERSVQYHIEHRSWGALSTNVLCQSVKFVVHFVQDVDGCMCQVKFHFYFQIPTCSFRTQGRLGWCWCSTHCERQVRPRDSRESYSVCGFIHSGVLCLAIDDAYSES